MTAGTDLPPLLRLPVGTVRELETQRNTALHAARETAEALRAARQRIAEITTYLLLCPDDTPLDVVRAEVRSIAAGEHEPGRDRA